MSEGRNSNPYDVSGINDRECSFKALKSIENDGREEKVNDGVWRNVKDGCIVEDKEFFSFEKLQFVIYFPKKNEDAF